MNMRTSWMMSAILGGSILAGCSMKTSDSGTSAESEIQSETVLFESELRDDPKAKVDDFCDVYTELKVVKTKSGTLKAKLENKLAGTCEIAIVPDAREYTLTQSEDCGSAMYKGSKGKDSIDIQDNRSRMCEDVRPSTIEVTESYNGVTDVHSYGEVKISKPAPTKPTTPSKPKSLLNVKLYDAPNASPDPTCDVFTQLWIAEADGVTRATLQTSLIGQCEIVIVHDRRSFDVVKSEDCGSVIYTATAGAKTFRIQDNASRTCEDIRPAIVDGNEGKDFFYSNP